MPQNNAVEFKTGTSSDYLEAKNAGLISENTLYFCSDTKQLFKGEDMYAFGSAIDVKDWAMVQKIVKAGLAPQFFEVGDILTSKSQWGEIGWRIIGFDHDKVDPTDDSEHTMTIKMVRTTPEGNNSEEEIIYADPIAFAYVDKCTLSDQSVITEDMTYKGETSDIPDISSANEGEVWKYTGEATTIQVDYGETGDLVDLAINPYDIITKSPVNGSYWAKVVTFDLLGSKGEYEIESYRIGSDIDVSQGFTFLLNQSSYLYPQDDDHRAYVRELYTPLYTGVRIGYIKWDFLGYAGATDISHYLFEGSSGSIYEEHYVDELPASVDSSGSYYYLTTNNHVYKSHWIHPEEGDPTFEWIDLGECAWPPTSPVAERGNVDYKLSSVRQVLNSNKEKAFDASTWQPRQEYGVFDRIPFWQGPGFMYQLDDELVDVLVSPQKKCFDGGVSEFTAHLVVDIEDAEKGLDVHIDKYLLDYATCNKPGTPDSDFWVNPFGGGQPMIVGDIPPEMGPSMTLQDVADMIDAGQVPEEYHLDKHPCVMYVTSIPQEPTVLPNGLEVSNPYSYPADEQGTMVLYFYMLIYYPQQGVDTVYSFYPVQPINEAAMLYTDHMTALQTFNDKIFMLGNAEVMSWGSGDEGMPYEYYLKNLRNQTIMPTIYRVCHGVDKTDEEIAENPDEGNYWWLRSVYWAYRNCVADVYGNGYTVAGDRPRYNYCVSPACVIG